MKLRWDAVVIDCRDAEALAAFWTSLLGVEVRGRLKQYVGLHPMGPDQPRLLFQQTDDPRPPKNTLHLDLHVAGDDLPAAVDRAIALGARPVEEHELDGYTWRTMADPEGNLFCLVAD